MHINQDIESRDELQYSRKPGGRRWVRITLLAMVVVLAGWYFLGGDRQQPGQDGRDPSKISGLPAKSNASTTFRLSSMGDGSRDASPEEALDASSPARVPLSTAVIKKGDRAREMIGKFRGQEKMPDLDEIFEHAERFTDEGMLVDAHLMYFFAAKRGHAESALMLGTMYDPAHALEVPSVIEEPGWTQAHKWYLRATEGGNKTARNRLEYLREQVEQAAANGNREAARLALQWQ